jgi:hypothetical protein
MIFIVSVFSDRKPTITNFLSINQLSTSLCENQCFFNRFVISYDGNKLHLLKITLVWLIWGLWFSLISKVKVNYRGQYCESCSFLYLIFRRTSDSWNSGKVRYGCVQNQAVGMQQRLKVSECSYHNSMAVCMTKVYVRWWRIWPQTIIILNIWIVKVVRSLIHVLSK